MASRRTSCSDVYGFIMPPVEKRNVHNVPYAHDVLIIDSYIWASPDKVDSKLRQVIIVSSLELFGGKISQRGMQTDTIVEALNVGKNISPGF